jgi:regulator of protease activity HflC (stomatin/prohibitin superfamily)
MIIVRKNEVALVERLGKYLSTRGPGMHFIVPLIDRVCARLPLSDQDIAIHAKDYRTSDAVTIEVEMLLSFAIVDPRQAYYGVKDFRAAAQQELHRAGESLFANYSLDECFQNRKQIGDRLNDSVRAAFKSWGIEAKKIAVTNIIMPAELVKVMEKQLNEERARRTQLIDEQRARFAKRSKENLVGSCVRISSDILAKSYGTAWFEGSEWPVFNSGDKTLRADSEVAISKVNLLFEV